MSGIWSYLESLKRGWLLSFFVRQYVLGIVLELILDETFLMILLDVHVLWCLFSVAGGNMNYSWPCVGFLRLAAYCFPVVFFQSSVIFSNLFADLYSVKDWIDPCVHLWISFSMQHSSFVVFFPVNSSLLSLSDL